MADFVFFLKNVLVVSLAMNMGLIWKIRYNDDEESLTASSRWGNIQQKLHFHGVYFYGENSNRIKDDEAHVSKTTQMLAIPDGLETVINLDQ